MSEITVFTARSIITMDPSLPRATAVAVRDGRILEVGTLDSLQPWLSQHPHTVDDRFIDQILMPGFIDPHLHPTMAAILLNMQFITAVEWRLPWATIKPTTSKEGFLERLVELDRQMGDDDEPLFTWGYHQLWHGHIRRQDLDALEIARPIVCWHRSFHEIVVNGAMLSWMGINAQDSHVQTNIDDGHFYENGLRVAINALNRHILAPERYGEGLERLKRVVHFGGHTTIGDMAAGLFNLESELQAAALLLDTDDTPFRTQMVPAGNILGAKYESHEAALGFIKTLPEKNTHRLEFRDHVKLFTDGAFFSELMQLSEPGYIDGHDGEWLMLPEQFEAAVRVYWNAGYKVHVHCTGDLGLEMALDTLEKMQWERPRFDHRYTIEHFGFCTQEQVRRIKALGAQVSANIYYLYELSDIYAKRSIGYERARQIGRLGSVARQGIPLAFHSDFTMAPALPLNSAHIAVNRINAAGDEMGPEEKLTVDQAMRAITIEAAYMLGMEDEVGSLRAGKKADFTVLANDPYNVAPSELRDIPIWGTVFEGRPFPIEK